MTRINVVPVDELSDQHLIAEYRELPRVFSQKLNLDGAPEKYCLGKGHVKWGRNHAKFIINRISQILNEMTFRGFHVSFWRPQSICALGEYWYSEPVSCFKDYVPTNDDIELNRARLIEKYRMRPNWYRWTKRKKPKYMED